MESKCIKQEMSEGQAGGRFGGRTESGTDVSSCYERESVAPAALRSRRSVGRRPGEHIHLQAQCIFCVRTKRAKEISMLYGHE